MGPSRTVPGEISGHREARSTWLLGAAISVVLVAWLRVAAPWPGAGAPGVDPAGVVRDAVLALPLVMLAAYASVLGAGTLRRRHALGEGATAAVRAAALAGGSASAVAVTVAVGGWFVGDLGPVHPAAVTRAALVALAVALPLAWAATALPAATRLTALRPGRRTVAAAGSGALLAATFVAASPLSPAAADPGGCDRTVRADVVAIDQPLVYNRLGTQNPTGMVYALRRDVVASSSGDGDELTPGNVALRPDKRPRPLTLRVNVGDCLQVEFENLLSPTALSDQPATRQAGINVNGLQLVASIDDDGSYVGANDNSLIGPGEHATYRFHAEREGTYLLNSTADNISGEAQTGTLAFGLFGAVNVEPRGSEWYRSQLTRQEMDLVTRGTTASGQPRIDYAGRYPAGHAFAGLPVLGILDGDEIVHSDLNAIVTGPGKGNFPPGTYTPNATYPNRNQPFREFTVVFHDEIKAVQAFDVFQHPDFKHTLHGVKDGFAINYGADGAGAEIYANRIGVGPMAECEDCKYEEFFLTSWAVGDPATLVDVPANADDEAPGFKATKVLYPDDPSNVFDSYLNDHVKIRNLHVGKEHHIFHLHAHQWLATPDDDQSSYLDSQAIGPGTGFTYEIAYNGSGNRNKTVGDSIFHCHFYPHFAQGMWALWRVHDTFEEGTPLDGDGRPVPGSRALPDAEITAGTPIPGVVPLPTLGMAPMPAEGVTLDADGQIDLSAVAAGENPGYPFWIPARAGHRPPTPPLDIIDDGGLPRHVVTGGEAVATTTPYDFNKELHVASAQFLPEDGTPAERAAMAFHADRYHPTTTPAGTAAQFETNGLPAVRGAPYAEPCRNDDGSGRPVDRTYQGANIQVDLKLNKAGWHYPQSRIIALWQDVGATLAGTRPPEPFVMRANSGDCIEYHHTNLVPHVFEQDAFQVKTPTDLVGQHIHLVKFDVTSADGSANGFNYEDGTFSPGEVRERIHALQAEGGSCTGVDGAAVDCSTLAPRAHPFFGAGPGGKWLGARTTVQRWWADPVRDNGGTDRGLGNVYTHDHYGPSTHQQVGLYGTLLVEPAGSTWRHPETGTPFGTRSDGGPTSWRADILTANPAHSHREFYFEFQDFQLAYEAGRGVDAAGRPIPDPMGAINPPSKKEVDGHELFRKLRPTESCPAGSANLVGDLGCPEAISAADVGTYSVNYRNEPLALRLRDPATNGQAGGQAGDPSLAFSSRVVRADSRLNGPGPYPPLTGGVQALDPFTPLMRAYDNDRVNVRIQVGAHEESHNATMHGMKWRQEHASPNSGWRNGQSLGISEQFQLTTPVAPRFQGQTRNTSDYLYAWSGSVDGLWNGVWGALRAYRAPQRDLLALPSNPVNGQGVAVGNLNQFNASCPKAAPVRKAAVTAVLARDALPAGTLTYNSRNPSDPLHDPTAIIYARNEDLDRNGRFRPGVPVEPLILRARAGECVEVTVTNRLPAQMPHLDGFSALPPIVDGFNANDVRASNLVGLRPQLLASITSQDDGASVGLNNINQLVFPGASRTYRWYAGDVSLRNGLAVPTPIEFGATNLISSDPLKHSGKGAVGALVVEPLGAVWTEDADRRASATVRRSNGSTLFREHVLIWQDDVNLRRGTGQGTALPFIAGNEDAEDSGGAALNYRTEPLWLRAGIDPAAAPTSPAVLGHDWADILSNGQVGGDPQTPVFTSTAGTPTRLRVLQPGGHARNHVVSVHGHSWQRTPYVDGSTALGDNPLAEHRGAQEGLGPANHFDLVLEHGAGGRSAVTGDYLIRDMAAGRFYDGTWGLLRVTE